MTTLYRASPSPRPAIGLLLMLALAACDWAQVPPQHECVGSACGPATCAEVTCVGGTYCAETPAPHCVSQGASCGGLQDLSCASGQVCDDPPDGRCHLQEPDCLGQCRPATCVDLPCNNPTTKCVETPTPHCIAIPCGGFPGLPCPGGLVCIDNPADNCNPQEGGADCGGICVITGAS